MGRLNGKVAIITGASGGLGAEMVRVFAREGASVVFGDIADEAGQVLEREVRQAGGDARYRRLDVTLEDDWRAAVAETVRDLDGCARTLVHVHYESEEDEPARLRQAMSRVKRALSTSAFAAVLVRSTPGHM